MSIKVALDEVRSVAAGQAPFAYLLTVSDDQSAHAVAVAPTIADGEITLSGGRTSCANALARPNVSLLWPPVDPADYSLIVDGVAHVDGSEVCIVPTRAVRHRPTPGGTGKRLRAGVARGGAMTTPRSRNVEVDGRNVGVYEYGDPQGSPVLVFHGTPACGAGFAFADAPARERGLRLIAPDRPGVGHSDRRPDWTVAEYTAEVGALADALHIESLAVWGYSGGGPYAVACAALLSKPVRATAVCAGSGQVGVWAANEDFEKTDKQMMGLAMTRPWLARLMLGTMARVARVAPKIAVKSFEPQLSRSDRQVISTLGTPHEQIALFTKAFTHGAHGVVADYAALAQPWGVSVESIRVPMTIFHGDDDPMVPLRHSEELAGRVPGAQLVVWPGEGHLGTVTHVGEVLDTLKH